MKKSLFLLTFLVFSNIQAQFESGTIYFKNGSSRSGYIKFKNYSEIKFKKEKLGEVQVYGYNELTKIYTGGTYYDFILVNNKPRYLKPEIKGKMNLYSEQGLHTDLYTGASFDKIIYYIEKNGKTVITNKEFKKKFDFLIKDCMGLYKAVKNKEINRKELKTIIEYYNEYCN